MTDITLSGIEKLAGKLADEVFDSGVGICGRWDLQRLLLDFAAKLSLQGDGSGAVPEGWPSREEIAHLIRRYIVVRFDQAHGRILRGQDEAADAVSRARNASVSSRSKGFRAS